MLPVIKLYYKVIITKTAWHWHLKQTQKSMEENREPQNKPMPISMTKEATIYWIQGGKDSLFNKWCWENWTNTCKRMKLVIFLNSKWIKDLSVRSETTKLEENLGSKPFDIALSKFFLDMFPWAREIEKWTNGTTLN